MHTWFLDPETRMNPNLNYGQGIPGMTEARHSGIIDPGSFVILPDLVSLLSPSSHWQPSYGEYIKEWFRNYGNWLINSKHGKEEAVHGNNHSTWYFAQLKNYLYSSARTIGQFVVISNQITLLG